MLLIAHRTPRTARECQELADLGAGAFEIDVQVRPHDDTVHVSHYQPVWPFGSALQRDNARVRFGYGPPHDATLVETLAHVPAGCDVLLDPKPRDPGAALRLVAALADLLPARGRFVVSTDREVELRAYAEAGFRTWYTVGDAAGLRAALTGPRSAQTGVSARHSVLDAHAVDALRERIGPVVAWTVNDPRRARQLRTMGVDGITTDRREVLSALREPE